MIMRKANFPDRRQITDLWARVFGDDKTVSERILDDFAGTGNVYVAEEGQHIIAQLLSVPCQAGGHKGSYLYALATEPEYRGKGVMSRLMDYARTSITATGASFFVLIPASRSLFDYYESYGFQSIYMQNMECSLDHIFQMTDTDNICDSNFIKDRIPADTFMALRQKYLDTDYVRFSEDKVAFELEEQWYYECESVYCDEGYVIYMKVDDTLFVTEVVASHQNMAQNLILSAGKSTDCKDVSITIPENSKLFSNSICSKNKTSQAQYKWWGKQDAPRFYIRYALDDLPARIQTNQRDIIL